MTHKQTRVESEECGYVLCINIVKECRRSTLLSHPCFICKVVNCSSVQLQTTGIVPTVAVEKTDGCQMYITAQVW